MHRQRFRRHTPYWLPVFCSLFLLSACGGEFSYKRGSTGADYQSVKKHCEQTHASASEVTQCLEQAGWVVVSAENSLIGRNATTLSPESVVDARIPELDPQADPFEKININSWWKAGASAEALLKQGNECAASLGEGHEPSANMSIVTRGLLACMGDKGWYALER